MTLASIWSRRSALLLGLGLLAGSSLWLTSCGRKKAEAAGPLRGTAVGVARVTRQDLARDVRLTAEFRAFQEIDVHAKVAGYVKNIYVDVGDHVSRGQLLAILEIPELQDEVNQAVAAVKRSEEEIRQAQGELDRSQSAHAATHGAYTRLAEVMKTRPDLVAQQDLDDAESRDKVSEAQITSARAALSVAEQQLVAAKANQQRLQTLYSYARITAPFTGVITKRYADTGAMIQAGTASQTQAMPVVRLSQNDLLRLVIPVPESVVPQIRVGTPVQVRVPVLQKTFQGTVARFADKVDFATRTMETEIDVPNAKQELVPGMYAEATISLERKPNVLVVPVQALNRHEGQVSVYRVTADNRIEEQPVTLGLETPATAEVLSGLKENDLVVVGGRGQLRPGERVEPKPVTLHSGGES